MFGFEKWRQQSINAQQPLSREDHVTVFDPREVFLLKTFPRRRELGQHVGLKFLFEISRFDSPEFHLQNQFANEKLPPRRRQCTTQRKSSLLDARGIILPLVEVLVMDAADM